VRRYASPEELDTLVPELLNLGENLEYADTLDREARENTWNARVDAVMHGLGM
jgi:hypothetical protein